MMIGVEYLGQNNYLIYKIGSNNITDMIHKVSNYDICCTIFDSMYKLKVEIYSIYLLKKKYICVCVYVYVCVYIWYFMILATNLKEWFHWRDYFYQAFILLSNLCPWKTNIFLKHVCHIQAILYPRINPVNNICCSQCIVQSGLRLFFSFFICYSYFYWLYLIYDTRIILELC